MIKRRLMSIVLTAVLAVGSFSVSSGNVTAAGNEQGSAVKYSSEWAGGKWYDSDGSITYCFDGSWKSDSKGWWYEDTSGWYAKDMWQKIDGKYYYFSSTGYIEYSAYRDGCWLGSDGAWVESYSGGHWIQDATGWWYEDASGWYPADQSLTIDGVEYTFGSDGYVYENKVEINWALILVNKDNPVPDNYSVNLWTLGNGKQVDSRIYTPLQNMFDAARASGLNLYVREGYRTKEDQQNIMNTRIKQYQDKGYSYSKAVQLAKQYVAVPGTSEHELGICVDINPEKDEDKDALYEWLDNNAYKYGFIKRYPEDKSDITGIGYEPWHYRYVGKEAAAQMKHKNMCLEEYLDYLSN